MLRENIAALIWLYARPATGISRILDRGRLWIALGIAVAVSLLVHLPQIQSATKDAIAQQSAQKQAQPESDDDEASPKTAARPPLGIQAVTRWAALDPFSFLSPIGAIALAFVPAILFTRAAIGFGSFSILMRSEYLSLLMCLLMIWSAAYLPLAIMTTLAGVHPALFAAANLYFTILAAMGIRTALGTETGQAAGLAVVGSLCAVGGIALFEIGGPMRYYMTSPFLLYYGYSLFANDMRSLGDGLRSRQHLRNQLEIATNNPRDADAHYQLGLIYQKRRQYTEAIARFQRAVEIDAKEAEPHLQLGGIAREQGRSEDAIRYLTTAVSLDDKLAQSDVWRELGAAYVAANRMDEAAQALAKYVGRREYDPEGLYWYGVVLKRAGQTKEAREMFQRCIDAVKSMPPHRRAELRHWGGKAKREM